MVRITAARRCGWTEVAGQRAELVIAKLSGILVNGAGVINASQVPLSTGTPLLKGGALNAWRVQGGQVSIEGAGLWARRWPLLATCACAPRGWARTATSDPWHRVQRSRPSAMVLG